MWNRVPERSRTSSIINSYMVLALLDLNRTDDALALLNRIDFAGQSATSLRSSVEAVVAAKRGDQAQAQKSISDTLAQRKQSGHFHHALYNVACAYALLNEKESALQALQDVAHDGFPCYSIFQSDPKLKNLKDYQPFQDFLAEEKVRYDQLKREFGKRPLPPKTR
jgi:hypothetical protein